MNIHKLQLLCNTQTALHHPTKASKAWQTAFELMPIFIFIVVRTYIRPTQTKPSTLSQLIGSNMPALYTHI